MKGSKKKKPQVKLSKKISKTNVKPVAKVTPTLVLTSRGLLVDDAEMRQALTPRNYEKMLQLLTISNRFFIGKDRTTTITAKIFKYIVAPKKGGGTRKLLAIPRFGIDWFEDLLPNYNMKVVHPKELKRIPRSKFTKPDPDDPSKSIPSLTPYPAQVPVIDYLMSEVFDTTGEMNDNFARSSCNLIMGTGDGKTYTAGCIIMKIRLPTLIICHNSRGVAEWQKMLKNFPQLKIGHYHSKKKCDGDVVIMVVNSAMRSNFEFITKTKVNGKMKTTKTLISRDKYFRKFGFVVYDEVPSYVADKRRAVFWETNFKYALGLTATPDENLKKLDDVYKYHLGPLIYAEDIPGYSNANVEWDFTVHVLDYYGPEEHTEDKISKKTGMVVSAWMAEQFSNDPYRIQLFLNTVRDCYDRGKNIMVFSEKRSILIKLSEIIRERLGIVVGVETAEDEKVKTIMGGADADDVEIAEELSRIVLTTYQYASMCMSIVKMDCGISFTPRTNGMKQVCGRITRKGGDITKPREYYDINDMNTKKGKTFSTRNVAYKDKGFKVVRKKVHWEDIELDE